MYPCIHVNNGVFGLFVSMEERFVRAKRPIVCSATLVSNFAFLAAYLRAEGRKKPSRIALSGTCNSLWSPPYESQSEIMAKRIEMSFEILRTGLKKN